MSVCLSLPQQTHPFPTFLSPLSGVPSSHSSLRGSGDYMTSLDKTPAGAHHVDEDDYGKTPEHMGRNIASLKEDAANAGDVSNVREL